MTDEPGARRYSDREVAQILKAAVTLQERQHASPYTRGLSLAELEQAAAEVGLDPALVRRAAAEVSARGASSEDSRFLGGPTSVVAERVVDGEIGEGSLEELLDAVRQATGELGQPSTVGRVFGWSGRLDGAKAEVGVSSRDGRTFVRVRVALDEVAVGNFMMLGMLGGVGGGIVTFAAVANPLGAAAALVGGGVVGAGYLAARIAFARAARGYRRRTEELADALAARVAELARAAPPMAPPAFPASEAPLPPAAEPPPSTG